MESNSSPSSTGAPPSSIGGAVRTLARGTIGTWSSSVQLRILHTERAPARLSLVAGRAGDGNRDQDYEVRKPTCARPLFRVTGFEP